MKKILLSLLVTTFFISSANAAFLVEPYLGMHFNSEGDSSTGGDSEMTGTALGARLGYQSLGLMLGLNYKTATLEWDPKDNSGKVDSKLTQYGLFVGYNFPVLVRVWGEYVIGGEADFDTVNYEKITGTQLGVGYTGLPFVSINLEIGNTKYDDGKVSVGSTNSTVDVTSYLLSVSLPLTL